MIISDKREKYDGSQRVVLWDRDEDGRYTSSLKHVEFHEMIDIFFEQKQKETVRLLESLFGGEISPISFFMQLQSLTVAETASRVQLGASKVRRHLTPEGFDGIKISTLKRYAKVFGVAVSDFFQFTHVPEGIKVETDTTRDRLVQKLVISIEE